MRGDHKRSTALGQMAAMINTFDENASTFRQFNRFFTQKIGVLDEDYLGSRFSLSKVRVLYELAHRRKATATEIGKELGLDAGYLSRIISNFAEEGLIDSKPSKTDGRQAILQLTKQGLKTFATLNARAEEKAATMLNPLTANERERLFDAMRTVESVLGGQHNTESSYALRTTHAGDLGWIVHRHGALYFQEYGWDEHFEGLVASIVAEFVEHLDPKRERCWIAEKDHEIVGCVFLVKKSATVAQLRLLLVEPKARGLGVGTRLVDECTAFAKSVGYRSIILWTNDVLHAARHVYEKAGYRLVREENHHSFGHDLVGETWKLKL